VNLLVRKGNPGFNTNEAEATFKTRPETEWPLARTEYKCFYLSEQGGLQEARPHAENTFKLEALGKSSPLAFEARFGQETEIAGHPTANLVYSLLRREDGTAPRDIDVFLTLRHFAPDGKEVFYTGEGSIFASAPLGRRRVIANSLHAGTAGDPVPLAKGWLRGSLRKINESSTRHREWLPHREYRSTDVQYLVPEERYSLLVEIWPTACVIDAGGRLVLEVASGDTQGSGIFLHNDPVDR
jgi:hypothetical protein